MGPNNPFTPFLQPRGPNLKVIQAMLQQIGAATSGTKKVLQSRLFQETHLENQECKPPTSRKKSPRILSIDMGIKNLAFCVADVSFSTPKEDTTMDILSWRRLDLTDDTLKANVKGDLEYSIVNEAKAKETDPFAPEFLSQTAYWLLSRNLLLFNPDIILIERQRWRSSSSSAIQQWTVRVNSLEAMLWAILTALRAESKMPDAPKSLVQRKAFSIFAVDPKRVGAYWLSQESPATSLTDTKTNAVAEDILEEGVDDDENSSHSEKSPRKSSARPSKKISRGKAEKKAKIQLLRTWLNHKKPSTSLSIGTEHGQASITRKPSINFKFHDHLNNPGQDAETTRQTFLYATDAPFARTARAKNAPGVKIRIEDVKKVDDLTDCLLQASAYVSWAENLAKLQSDFALFKSVVEETLGENSKTRTKTKTTRARTFTDQTEAEVQSERGSRRQRDSAAETISDKAVEEFEDLLAAAAARIVKDEKEPRKTRKTLKTRKQET